MKSLLLTVFAVFALSAQAHDLHTPNYCHSQIKNFCAHLGYDNHPQVGEEFSFVVDLVAPKEALDSVETVNVELFMPSMGHGSAPVSVKRLDLKHFEVTEAFFTMPGMWSVNVEVVTKTGTIPLQIPFEVK